MIKPVIYNKATLGTDTERKDAFSMAGIIGVNLRLGAHITPPLGTRTNTRGKKQLPLSATASGDYEKLLYMCAQQPRPSDDSVPLITEKGKRRFSC